MKKVFDNVKLLIINGTGEITICADGRIKGATKVDQTRTALLIEANTLSFTIDDLAFNYSIHRGVTMGPINERRQACVYYLGQNCRIEQVFVQNCVVLTPLPDNFTGTTFTAKTRNASCIILPNKHFDTLVASVNGSGSITGETSAGVAIIDIAGDGCVTGIHIQNEGATNVTGNGEINVTASNPGKIVENTIGSGRIKIK